MATPRPLAEADDDDEEEERITRTDGRARMG